MNRFFILLPHLGVLDVPCVFICVIVPTPYILTFCNIINIFYACICYCYNIITLKLQVTDAKLNYYKLAIPNIGLSSHDKATKLIIPNIALSLQDNATKTPHVILTSIILSFVLFSWDLVKLPIIFSAQLIVVLLDNINKQEHT